MKNATLLLLCGTLLLCACEKSPIWDFFSKDSSLTGTEVDLKGFKTDVSKLFVLNEGGMGSNNASLDFMRFSNGNYVTSAFKKMNPEIGAGLGDVGNDIVVIGNEVWIVVNNSGLVEVISATDETEIAAIAVPTPRNIAFDSNYAYVTSWAGAYVTYDSNYMVSDSKNPKGQVYRIGLKTKKVEGSVEVGYQPEGIAYYDGKLYVANSGGISSSLPPSYSYDNTLSIVDVQSFKVVQTVEVAPNLHEVYSAGQGVVYVTSMGDYFMNHTGLFYIYAANPSTVHKAGKNLQQPGDLQVSISCQYGDTVYCAGTRDEFDWSSAHSYYLWSFSIIDQGTDRGKVVLYPRELVGTPYGLAVINHIADVGGHYLFVGDAGDYFNPGTVSCYELDFGSAAKLWTVPAGVCPGHFAIW